MDRRVPLCGAVAIVSAIAVPAMAQSAYAGICHLIPKPGPFAAQADHQRYQTEMAACLAQPPLPPFKLDATIPLQAKPPQMINPLTALEQAARVRQLQAQTEALRAQTEALRTARTNNASPNRTDQPHANSNDSTRGISAAQGDTAESANDVLILPEEQRILVLMYATALVLAEAGSAHDWADRRQRLYDGGMPAKVLDQFETEYSPSAVAFAARLVKVFGAASQTPAR